MSAFKATVRRLFGAAGFEIQRRDGEDPVARFMADPPTPPEQAWAWYHVSQMANRAHRPSVLAYRRGPHGDDTRVKYITYFLDVRNARILELGPFEGHHSVLLEKMGVAENIAVEARQDNLDTCLRIHRDYQLDKTHFVLGDVERIVAGDESPPFTGPFDLVFCCGLFYHLTEPLPFLQWCRKMSDRLFLGTQIVYPDAGATEQYTSGDHSYACALYGEGGIDDLISGMSPKSVCLAEPELVRMLEDAGYRSVQILGHDIQNGAPHTTILAET